MKINILKSESLKLRKQGFSYREINKKIKVSTSTLSGWLKDEVWSENIKKNLTEKMGDFWRANGKKRGLERREKWERISLQSRLLAQEQFKINIKKNLFVAGLMLYWGEGDNSLGSVVRIANSNPSIIRIFNLFLQQFCQEFYFKTKMNLILYPDLDDQLCKVYWSNKVGLPLDRFIKSEYIVGRHKIKRLSHGTAILYISSRELKEKILEWLKMSGVYLAGIV